MDRTAAVEHPNGRLNGGRTAMGKPLILIVEDEEPLTRHAPLQP